jgi:membrane-associated protease RseP (regulator of RpoE activity)
LDARRWALTAGVVLAVIIVGGAAVALLGQGNSTPSSNSSLPLAQTPPSGQNPPGAGQNSIGGGQGYPRTGQGAQGGGAGNGSGPSAAIAEAWLGIQSQSSSTGGVLIDGIVAGSAADAAALRPGDIILAINDQSVGSEQQLGDAMSGLSAGQTVTVRVRRGSATFTTQVTLGERPSGYSSP